MLSQWSWFFNQSCRPVLTTYSKKPGMRILLFRAFFLSKLLASRTQPNIGKIDIENSWTISGWWLVYLPLWKYEFVKWDDDIPNIWKVIKHVPNHQPDFCTDSFLLQAMDFLSIIKQRTDLVPSNSCLARNAAISFFSLWNMDWKRIPSGKHTKNYGKSPCYQWVNPLCAIFNSYGWLDYPQKKWENHRKIQETYGKNMEKLAMEV